VARSVRLNIVANYVGSGWSALMGLVFVPVYISYLGIEAYGLIGLFATLQAWLALLDLGLSPTLSREMARLRGGAHTAESIRDLLRSVEIIYAATAIIIAIAIFLASGWLASNWLHAEKLPLDTVASALSITGLVIACRWIGGLYRSAMAGLQEQVWLNTSNIVFATLRGAGVIVVLAFVSDSIEAFFLFQGLLAGLEAIVLAWLVYRHLPSSSRAGEFSLAALRSVWRFAAGLTVITVLSLIVGQVDKIVLPTVLPLSQFGYYALAGAVAGALSVLTGPVATAIGPRFAELVAQGAHDDLAFAYHRYTQLLAMMLIPAVGVLSLFSHTLLMLWTRDEVTSRAVAPLVSILAIGTGLGGLGLVPLMLQLAHGWTRFAAVVNAVSGVFFVPAILIAVPRWGSVGAAVAGVMLSAGYILIAVPAMHRQLLRGHLRKWYLEDVVPPIVCVAAVLVAYRLLVVWRPAGIFSDLLAIAAAVVLAGAASVLATPLGRELARRLINRVKLALQ
jgi:O-antigen/teichoic acid export membrane protein